MTSPSGNMPNSVQKNVTDLPEKHKEPNGSTKVIKDRQQLVDFDPWRITKESDIQQSKPIILIGAAAVAAKKNITVFSAASKAGKTSVVGVILAGAISNTVGTVDGFTDLEVLPNIDGKAVIHFDTEQSDEDHQSLVNSILKRADMESTPDYFRSYNIRQLTINDYRIFTTKVCELCNQEFNGVHMIVVDGGADYISNVNDEQQASEIVEYFIHLSIKYDCPVIIIIHLNPGSEKERGHIGSSLQRKCYGLLTITKEDDVSTLQPKLFRKAGVSDIPLIHFKYSKDVGYHVQVDGLNKIDVKATRSMSLLKKISTEVFTPPASYTHKEAVQQIMLNISKSKTTAKERLEEMKVFGLIVLGADKRYRLTDAKSK